MVGSVCSFWCGSCRYLGKWASKLVRVQAVDKDDVTRCLDNGWCGKDPEAKVLGRDFMNTDGYLYWELHEKNIFSPGEFGCTFSHIKAAYQAFIDEEQTALIVEDDISLEDVHRWPETIQEIVAEAPADWGILQLWTNNPAFYKYYQRGQSEDEMPPMAKTEVDPDRAVCEDHHYHRPAFVPWWDDVFEYTGQYYGGLWSTMAYLINRKGMNAIITNLRASQNNLGNLSLPVLADHLIFKTAKTYTYTRPLFRAYSRESTIQPVMEKDLDPTKGRVAPGDDPHWATDGLTNKFIGQYWNAGTCPLVNPESKPLNIVVLATTSFEEEWIHLGNVDKLARGMDGARVVLYAINAIDNKVAEWHTKWTQNAEKQGIPVMVRSSKRNMERGFESKLVSQLPLMGHIRKRVAFDYIFTIDGDISLANADLNGLVRSIHGQRPLIAQPTIRVPPNLVGGNMFTWGSQWYKALNDEHASSCGDFQEFDSPIVESQAAILSKTFLDWYHQELEQVAQVQHQYQCDWGHDEMWCSAAARLSEKLPHSPPACVIIRHSVDHHDTKSIAKYAMHSDGGTFLSDCQKLEQVMQEDKDKATKNNASPTAKGKQTGISVAALRDHTNLTCVNAWADLNGGGCKPPNRDADSFSAVKSFRTFMSGTACRELQDAKAAAELAAAGSKSLDNNFAAKDLDNYFATTAKVQSAQGQGSTPSQGLNCESWCGSKANLVGLARVCTVIPECKGCGMCDNADLKDANHYGTRFESESASEHSGVDVLSKGRREFGPHFAPVRPSSQDTLGPRAQTGSPWPRASLSDGHLRDHR